MSKEYNRIEARYLGDLVRRTGKTRFAAWQRLPSGDLLFTAPSAQSAPGEPTLVESARDALDRGEELEVEATEKLPGIFSGRTPPPADGENPGERTDDWAFLGLRQARHVFTGTVVDVDLTAGTITIRPARRQDGGVPGVGGDTGIQLKQAGWLHRRPGRPAPDRAAQARLQQAPGQWHVHPEPAGAARGPAGRREAAGEAHHAAVGSGVGGLRRNPHGQSAEGNRPSPEHAGYRGHPGAAGNGEDGRYRRDPDQARRTGQVLR